MRRKVARYLAAGLLVFLLLLAAGTAYARLTGYHLTEWTVDSGGGTSTGMSYSLSGTLGQPDAGELSGTGYTLAGGFWAGGQTLQATRSLFLPVIIH